jgi:hypothetical protein
MLLDINKDLQLGGEPNEAELRLRLPNGSLIYLAGANERHRIEDFRGLPLGMIVLDEAQVFPAYIQDLLDSVLTPAMMDYNGVLVLAGTPGPIPAGYFFEATKSEAWGHFGWNRWANPWIEIKSGKSVEAHLADELKRRGVAVDDPAIRREWFGEWVMDEDSLVFHYDAQKNGFTSLPRFQYGEWKHVVGVDLGWDDADAVAVLAWHEDSPAVYLVDEWVGPKQLISTLGERLKKISEKYNPQAIVVDTGGLGRKIAEELSDRFGLVLEAAQKERKAEHVELLNDALRSGRFFARPDGRFAADSMVLEWSEFDHKHPEKRTISSATHSDICDSALYGYRYCLHWLHLVPDAPPPRPGSREWQMAEEKHMKEELCARVEEKKAEAEEMAGWDDFDMEPF